MFLLYVQPVRILSSEKIPTIQTVLESKIKWVITEPKPRAGAVGRDLLDDSSRFLLLTLVVLRMGRPTSWL